MASATQTTPLTFADPREAWIQSQRKHQALQEKLKQLEVQREAIQATVARLQQDRVQLVDRIAGGLAKEADLVKLRKTLNTAQDELTDTDDVRKATEKALAQAWTEVEAARTTFRNSEQKSWREVHATLIARHKDAVQEITNYLYVAALEASPGLGELHYWSVLNALDLKKPDPEEIKRLKSHLLEEFTLT